MKSKSTITRIIFVINSGFMPKNGIKISPAKGSAVVLVVVANDGTESEKN